VTVAAGVEVVGVGVGEGVVLGLLPVLVEVLELGDVL
jgi:hypothetical protein